MTDRDAMIERAKAFDAERGTPDLHRNSQVVKYLADFALAEIARAEADLRARLVAELETKRLKEDGQRYWRERHNDTLDKCIDIVRGESKES